MCFHRFLIDRIPCDFYQQRTASAHNKMYMKKSISSKRYCNVARIFPTMVHGYKEAGN